MLGFARRQPAGAEAQALLPVCGGGALLAEHEVTLARIRSIVGVPAQHWRRLYQALFAAYAELVQAIPLASASNFQSTTLLQHALSTVELTMKVRRGYVLPPGQEPEVVADEQDVWTYAVATAALLQGSGCALLDQSVTLYDRNRKRVGTWSPWTGPMTRSGGRCYRIDAGHAASSGLMRSAFALLTAPYVIPADGMRWLAGHEAAMTEWLTTVSGQDGASTTIREIIGRATQLPAAAPLSETRAPARAKLLHSRSVSMPLGSDDDLVRAPAGETDRPEVEGGEAVVSEGVGAGTDPRAKPESPNTGGSVDDAGEAFFQWLVDGIRSEKLAVNSAKAHLHVVDAGLLLASPTVFRAFAGDDWREAQKRFLKRKLNEKTANGGNIFHYCWASAQGRKVIKGILIRNAEAALGVTLPKADSRLAPKANGR